MAKSKGLIPCLEGFILPDKDRDRDHEAASGEDSEGDGEEDATTEFLDMEEMSNSPSDTAWVNQASARRRRKVRFQKFSGGEVWVTGSFALSAPWWHITCHTQGSKHYLTVKGSAWYKLRTDLDKDGWRPIVSLFLVACGVERGSITRFLEWSPDEHLVTVGNVLEVLAEFRDNCDSDLAQSIIKCVSASAEGRRVRASSSYPGVMRLLPVLLPRQFEALLSPPSKDNVDHADRLLARLEDIIKKDVWKLGFYELMPEALKLRRCEAKLEAFEECGLLKEMPRPEHNALWVYDQVKRFCANTGSTYMEIGEICEKLRKKPNIPDEQVWAALLFLKNLGVMMLDNQKVVLQKLHEYESGIADSLRHLVDAEQWTIPINAEEVLYAYAQTSRRAKMEKDPTMVDRYQLRAAQMICSNPVTVISGKGGCGKTTVVSLLLRAAVEKGRSIWKESATAFADAEDPGDKGKEEEEEEEEEEEIERPDDELLKEHILLTAPTGRAASLLTKKTGFEAFTLHQVIWRCSMAEKNKKKLEVDGLTGCAEECAQECPFRSVRVLVLDEGSLVPVGLLHAVLSRLIRHAKLQKFIILGDVRQLPSIQPGNTLKDLFSSLTVVNHTVEMLINHRSESELIVANAQRIADMAGIRFDHVVNLPGPFNIPLDKKFIHIRLPDDKGDDDLQQAVKGLINSAPGLDDHSKSQFIAFKRADVKLINELCCNHYNKHPTKDHNLKLRFQPGDKVCITKNGFIDREDAEAKMETQRNPDVDDEKQEKIRLCNGEIFFITEDNTVLGGPSPKKRVLTLDDQWGRTVEAQYGALLRSCKLRHAWARTIHTFQGSESETVVYVVGTSGYQNWMHVYTAVTRGQKRVYVVSTDAELKGALSRRENPRLTRLAGLVKEQVVQLVQASPNLQRNHNGSPKFTSQKSTPHWPSPQVPPWQTPRSKAIVPKRLLGAGGPVGAPDSSPMKENVDVKRGTARLGAAATAAAETESGSPPRKKTTITKNLDAATDCNRLQQPFLGSPMQDLTLNAQKTPVTQLTNDMDPTEPSIGSNDGKSGNR